MNNSKRKGRVAIIGCREFGAENLYSLVITGAVDEVALIDGECSELIEDFDKLHASIPLSNAPRVFKGNFSDSETAQVAVIANEADITEGDSQLDHFNKNVRNVRESAYHLRENNFKGVMIITIGPVDLLAKVALEASGLPECQVIGSGNGLERISLEPDEINESNATPNVTWCATSKCDSPLIEHCQPNCPGFGEMVAIHKKDSIDNTYPNDRPFLSASSCIPRICEAVLKDERTILPVTAYTTGQYGVNDIFMNLPCIIRKIGVERALELDITEIEAKQFQNQSDNLKRTYKKYVAKEHFASATM